MKAARKLKLGEAAFAAVVLCLGLFLAVQTIAMGGGPQYAVVGPRAFPAGVAAGLLVLGALELWSAVRSDDEPQQRMELDWIPLAWVAAALLLQLALLKWLGWIPVATLIFVAVARALGSRSLRKELLLGMAMALATFLIFNYVLGLGLPWGSLIEPLANRFGVV